jgi:hypothetical protein
MPGRATSTCAHGAFGQAAFPQAHFDHDHLLSGTGRQASISSPDCADVEAKTLIPQEVRYYLRLIRRSASRISTNVRSI